jgi:hypothetical protein
MKNFPLPFQLSLIQLNFRIYFRQKKSRESLRVSERGSEFYYREKTEGKKSEIVAENFFILSLVPVADDDELFLLFTSQSRSHALFTLTQR